MPLPFLLPSAGGSEAGTGSEAACVEGIKLVDGMGWHSLLA